MEILNYKEETSTEKQWCRLLLLLILVCLVLFGIVWARMTRVINEKFLSIITLTTEHF